MTDWTLQEFLNHLRSLDIRLGLDGDRLACNAPKGALTGDIKTELQRRKSDILTFLRDTVVADGGPGGENVSVRRTTPQVSFSQQRLWFLDRMSPGNPMYNLVGALRLQGALDRDALERSLHEIVLRHDVLRTVFRERDGLPEAIVGPGDDWRMAVDDLRSVAPGERESEGERRIRAEIARAYDLATGPLVRITLYVLSEQEYILLVGMHHIVSDGWSLGVLMGELGQLYPAFRAGQPSPLPTLAVQYGDFVDWYHRSLEGGVLGEQIPFWKETLAAPLPALELPLDRPRPPIQTFHGRRIAVSIPPSLYEAIKAFSSQEQVPVFTTVLTAYYILLARYTGQDDVVVGTAVANRSQPEFANLIGLFANTVVLRADLSGNPTVRECVQRIRTNTLAAFAKQDVPFDRLVEVLKPERALDRSPLFQTMFVLQNWLTTELELPELVVNRMDIGSDIARFDLSIDAIEYEGNLRLYIEYNTDLFDAASIQRLQQHYQIVLAEMTGNPDQSIACLQLLTPQEQQQMLSDWNATGASYPESARVHDLIDLQALRTPDAEAVRWEQNTLSYGELVTRANQLAHHLRTIGVGPETLVGVCVERTHDMIVALLAVWKAGGAYVPLDPLYPQERLAFMASDAGLTALITESALTETIPGLQCPVVLLDSERSRFAEYPESAPESGAQSGSDTSPLAYVLYTSGSTGQPKGVMIEHRALLNFLYAMQREPGLSAKDTLLSVTTLSFDIAGLEMYLPLITGARVVLVSRAVAGDGLQLARTMRDTGTTVMQATPATWRLLLDSGWRAGDGLTVLCGGEALPPQLANMLLDTGATVWNLYGPTETTIWSTVHRVHLDEDPMPIGRPIANTQVYVLDVNMQPVPIHVTGELYIGGDGLARGYHRRPELTAERFVPNPFVGDLRSSDVSVRADAPAPRLYRTGDQVRLRADGTLEYVGRVDHQVKVRGFRIELGEIESVLSMHDQVGQAVVMVREDVPGDQRLVAYVVASAEARASGWSEGAAPDSLSIANLRTHLAAYLPQFMIPSAFVMLETFPLTPNGKVDRRALSVPDATMRSAVSAFVSPKIGIESTVAEIWREVLRVDRVGIHDNFFDLGGHSLLVVQLQSKLRERFDREISLMDLFRRPTVGAIAEFLSAPASGNADASAADRLGANVRDRARRQNLALSSE